MFNDQVWPIKKIAKMSRESSSEKITLEIDDFGNEDLAF